MSRRLAPVERARAEALVLGTREAEARLEAQEGLEALVEDGKARGLVSGFWTGYGCATLTLLPLAVAALALFKWAGPKLLAIL